MTKEQTYQEIYDEFIKDYNSGSTTGETVGYTVALMAQYFGMQNLSVVQAESIYARKAAEVEMKIDENGKAISSSKAKIIVEATPEAELRRTAQAHLSNIETYINALKALQKGILNEYSHMGQT
jgi:hypothetical protein